MAFKNFDKPTDLAEWTKAGIEPSGAEKTTGFYQDFRPPMDWFNWFWKLVSDWQNYLNDQKAVETTTQNDSYTSTSYADAQAYLDSLPTQINHTIVLALGGTGYATNTLSLSNHYGDGSIEIDGGGVAAIGKITATNIKLPLSFIDTSFDGDTTRNGLEVTQCSNVSLINCSFTECVYCIDSTRSDIQVSGWIIDSDNDTFGRALVNSKFTVGTGTQNNALTSYVYVIDSNSKVATIDDGRIYTSHTDFMTCQDGGEYSGVFGINGNHDTDKTVTLVAADMPYINSHIQAIGQYVPPNSKLTINLPAYSSTIDNNILKIHGFWGGGEVEIRGQNGGGTVFTGGAVVDIRGNACRVYINEVHLTDASNGSSVQCWDNTGLVYLNEMTVTNGAAGSRWGFMFRHCPNVYCIDLSVPNTNNTNGVYCYRSFVYMLTSTIRGSSNSVYILEGSEFRHNGNTFTDGTTAHNTASTFIP